MSYPGQIMNEVDMKHLDLQDMVDDAIYVGEGRNFDIGRWVQKDVENGRYNTGFEGIRNKFGMNYLFVELHWDADPRYGTFKPLRLATEEEAKEFENECRNI